MAFKVRSLIPLMPLQLSESQTQPDRQLHVPV
jgi:hypothetical protein